MSQLFFNTTLPATTQYYNLWTQIQGSIGTDLVPNLGYELILCSDSAIIRVAGSRYATSPGVPVQVNGNLTMRGPKNTIDLRNIFVSGSGAAISGAFSWT